MKKIHILLVEDNEGDIILTTEALEDCNFSHSMDIVRNGKEALDYVYKRGNYNNVKTPDLILLDINLPLVSGHEVLQVIKSDDNIKQIPVIMLTTSSTEKDIYTCYKHHANCYITKPVEVDQFNKAICSIQDFWLSIASLPEKKPDAKR